MSDCNHANTNSYSQMLRNNQNKFLDLQTEDLFNGPDCDNDTHTKWQFRDFAILFIFL